MKTFDLKSVKTSNLLIWFLFLGLSLEVLCTGLEIICAIQFKTGSYHSISNIADILAVINLFIFIVTAIIFLVWIYRVHKDLRVIYPDYPITTRMAMARIMIPFYNIWGFWNVFHNIAEHFKKEVDDIQKIGYQISLFVTYMYVTAFVSKGLDRIVTKWPDDDEGVVFFLASALLYISNAVLSLIWLKLTFQLRDVFTRKISLFGSVVKHPIEGYTVVS